MARHISLGGLGAAPPAVTQRKQGAGTEEASAPLTVPPGLAGGASRGVQFGPEVPAVVPRRSEGGSANLAAGLQVWQSRGFSSALYSAKPKMCLDRSPPLIFKPMCIFYVNLIHMFLIYFYLTHQIELGATMMKGAVPISKKNFEPFFLELNHLPTPSADR